MKKIVAAGQWVLSAEGRKDLGAAVAAVTAVYVVLHRAGVL